MSYLIEHFQVMSELCLFLSALVSSQVGCGVTSDCVPPLFTCAPGLVAFCEPSVNVCTCITPTREYLCSSFIDAMLFFLFFFLFFFFFSLFFERESLVTIY